MNRKGPALGPSRRPGEAGRSIRFAGVTKAFARTGQEPTLAIDAINLEIPARQFVAILGPSGCGKSTLLRLADGLIEPDRGRIEIGGVAPIPELGIGLVFQNFRLIPWRNVADNVGFVLEAGGFPAAERDARVRAHLDKVGLSQWAGHFPAQLSGGMCQRVALARALVGAPDVLLMDEPFASLDAQTRELMQEELLALWDRQRPTIVFVTHSVDEALLLADRVLVMGGGAILDDLVIDLPRPRTMASVAGLPLYAELRVHLWAQIRQLVLADPASAFFGRQGDRPGHDADA
ncbi:ABC transporter ATP-binding protein [Devosia sp. CAU 1758]